MSNGAAAPAVMTAPAISPSPGDTEGHRIDKGTKLAFWLVIAMLISLFVFIFMLLFGPVFFEKGADEARLDYYKWTMSALVGAFGAWIGAGAAHFFGRENLKESSRSTETALQLQLQGQALQGKKQRFERLGDLKLTTINSDFVFNAKSAKKEVLDGLQQHVNYWFVPELDGSAQGTLQDVIHSRVFWDAKFGDADELGAIVAKIDKDDTLKDLRPFHGEAFFQRTTQDDAIADAVNRMMQKKVEVGIVVDGAGRPTHCFTRTELEASLSAQQ